MFCQYLRTPKLQAGAVAHAKCFHYLLVILVVMAASAHFVDHINYLPSGNCWRKRLLCMLQLSVASCQLAMAAARGSMWHVALVAALLARRQTEICLQSWHWEWRPNSVWVLSLPLRLLSFDNLPPFLLPNKHLFVCFSISQRALFIRQHTDTNTHTMPEIQQKKWEKRKG